jgi:antitoxin HicB
MVTYTALFENADEGGFVVTFPDFGYGVTQGETEEECLNMASDLLACLIGDAIEAGKELPVQGKYRGKKYRSVEPPALAAVKAELYRAFLASGMRKAELARRLGIPKANIDRLFNVRHSTRIEQLEAAFRAIGKGMTIGVKDAA